jgi:hypothetical protein
VTTDPKSAPNSDFQVVSAALWAHIGALRSAVYDIIGHFREDIGASFLARL